MSKFYLVRHGNTNAGNRLVGRLEGFPLSDHGRKQIEATASHFLQNIKFSKFLCSPIVRTIQSAQIIYKYINQQPEINNNLIEVDFGVWTGKSFDELENEEQWKLFHSFRSGAIIPGGESIPQIQNRAVNLVLELYNSDPSGNNLIVTHAEIIRLILCYFAGIHLDYSYKIQIDTGSLSIISLNSGGAFIEGINLRGLG